MQYAALSRCITHSRRTDLSRRVEEEVEKKQPACRDLAAPTHLVAGHEQGRPHADPRDGLGRRGVEEHLVGDAAVAALDDGHVGKLGVFREDGRVQVDDGVVAR